jgi:hypothetical protein
MNLDELAQKYGGSPVQSGSSKLDELARKYGGSSAEVAQAPKEDGGFFSNVGNLLVEGGKRAIGSAKVSPSVIAGDVSEDKAKLLSEQLSMKPSVQPKELVEAQSAFKDEAAAFEKAKGFTESIGPFGAFLLEFGKQVVTNPKGAVYLTAQSAANMAPQIAGMIAGGKGGALAGSLAGPGGTAIGAGAGAIAGGFAAGTPLEIGSEFIGRIGEELQKRSMEPTEENITAILRDKKTVEQAISDARTKGVTTAAVDSLMTVGAGKFASGPRRVAIEAARKELGATADAAKIASRADEILKARTVGQKIGTGAGAVGIETAGGGASEAAGQLAAYGKVNLEDVGAEMLGELGGSAASIPAATYALGKDKLKEQARAEAGRILEQEAETKRAAEESTGAAVPEPQGGVGPSVTKESEPEPEPFVKPPSISGTKPGALLGEREDPLAKAVADRRAAAEPTGDIPLSDDYAFLQREKQRLLQQEQTPETKRMLGRINDQISIVIQRDIERLRSEAETLKRNREADEQATKTSVFGQEELPPVESRDVVVGNMELGELQAREAPPVDPLTGKELKGFRRLEGEPQPMIPEVEAEVEKLTQDQALAVAEREKLAKRTSGTSLSQVLRGTLRDAELSELGGRGRQVGKNPFLNLKAPKGQPGASMEDMVDTGKLDIFLPIKMRPGSPDYVNSESAEYVREKLRNNQLYTYETELAIQRVDNDIESIERQIQDLLSDDEINKELQYAANEQRELDQVIEEPTAPEADRTPEQREAEKADADFEKRKAQLDREQQLNEREARLLEERKRLEEERLKLESPTKEDVKQQEERKEKASELDEREQVRKESEAGAGQFALTSEEGRQDTTGDIFNQPEPTPTPEPEPEPEPMVVAISSEKERKDALSALKRLFGIQIPPFMSRGGDGRVQMLKPTKLNKDLQKEVLRLAEDAIDLGLPASVLGNVTGTGSTRMDATAAMTDKGKLLIGRQWSGSTKDERFLAIIHELGHIVDTNGGEVSNSANWSKAHNELKNWYANSTLPNKANKHPVAYPFAPQYKGSVRINKESFAQAFGYYFMAPVDLQTNAPEAYSQIQSIVQRIQDESQAARAAGKAKTGTTGIKIQPSRVIASKDSQSSPGAERDGVSQTARVGDRGAGKVSGVSAFNQEEIEKLRTPNYKGRERIIEMRIEDFLNLADDYTNDDSFNRKKKETAERLLREGVPYSTLPFLIVERDGQVSGHEGRHRAQALKDAGYTTIPVVIKSANIRWDQQDSPDRFDYVENWPERMKAQEDARNPRFSIPFPVSREDAGAPYDSEVQDINAMQPSPTRQNIFGEPVLGTWSITTDPKMEIKDGLIYKLLDKNIDVKRIIEAVKSTGKQIASQWNPYLQEELYHGRTANAAMEFQDKEWLPLLQDMNKKGVTIGELEQYLLNRHAEDYNKLMAKRNPNRPEMQDGASSVKTADARKYLADLDAETKAKYEELASRVDGITKGTRQLLVDTGYEKAATIKNWEEAFPNYVPLMREEGDFDYNFGSFGTGRGFDVRRDFSRSAMGSKRAVVDIIGNVISARNQAIALTEKNRVAQSVYGLALEAPNPDFWMVINPDLAEVREVERIKQKIAAYMEKKSDPNITEDELDEVRSNLDSQYRKLSLAKTKAQEAIDRVKSELVDLGIPEETITSVMMEPEQRILDPKKGEVVKRVNTKLRENDHVLATRINGEKRYVFFNPKDPRSKRAVTALKNLDAQDLGTALGMIAKVTRWMSSVNTQYNPIFGPYNFLRDVQSAALQLSTTELAGQQKEIAKDVIPSLRAIYSSLRSRRKGEEAKGDMAELWKEFQKEGGQTGFKDNFSRTQDRTEALLNEMERITEGKVKANARAVFDWLSDYNDSLENAVRLSAYKAAKAKFANEGFSDSEAKQKAASLAKNLTVNFNRKGDVATQMGALYAFFNASMQGTARMIETLKGPTGKKIMAGGLLLGSMQAALLAAAGFDDEEPPEFIRSKNIVIPTGGGDYVAFPMPLGFHVIPGTSRILSEWALSGFKDTARRVTDLTGLFLDAFNPVGNAGWSVQTITPTILDPLVALGENKDWTGKPISKEDLFSLRPTPGYTRAREGANWLSTNLAEFLNYASGGTKYQPGVLSPTPEQIEYLVGQAFGGVGREAIKLATTVEKTATGEDLPPYKIPLYGRFVGETKSSAAESNKFYKNMEKLNRLDLEIKGRREDKQPVSEFMRENPEARLLPMANKTYKDIQELRKRRTTLLERKASRETIQTIEGQISRKMQMLNDRVRAMEEK